MARIVQINVIKNNLRVLEDAYNETGHISDLKKGSLMAAFYSKLAIVELSGWIEQTIDRILEHYLMATVCNHRLRDLIKERVIGVVYSAKYQAVKDLFVDIIGSARFHSMMNRLEKKGQRQILIDRLNELNAERCSAAHTYFEGGVMQSYKSPSETMGKFNEVLPIMQSIERSLINFARRK